MVHDIPFQQHRIHCKVEGAGESVILLHGWPTNSRLWQAQLESLQSSYRVITPDWLGFGESDKPEGFSYTLAQMKNMLNTILNHLLEPEEQVTLVAHDIGGPPTVLWASENQDRVKKLILLNTVIYPFKTPLDALSSWIIGIPVLKDIFVSQFGLKNVLNTNTKSKGLSQFIERILEVYKGVPNSVRIHTLEEPLRSVRPKEKSVLAEKFAQLAVPKHLIIAKEDPLLYAHMQKLRKENPQVPAHYIENCGHFIPIDQPEVLNKILLRLLLENS
ncbi:MAG: alpha/beta hydrolase [Bacteroidota bacterium]